MLEVRNLDKRFGPIHVTRDVTRDVTLTLENENDHAAPLHE